MGQVVSQADLLLRRGQWKRAGQGVVCASGRFDLLHPGHIRLLEQARDLGEILVVAVQNDDGFASEPGQSRNTSSVVVPVTPAAERMEILAALAAVDYVVEFDGPSPYAFLLRLAPDVFVEGAASGDAHTDDTSLEKLGCKIVRFPIEPGYSTTRLIERIAEARA